MIRRCLDCSTRIPSGSRCSGCDTKRERVRSRERGTPEHYRGSWRRISREAREAHVRRYGLVCPGWKVPQHRVAAFRDLTADHVIAGRLDGGVVVLCRSCNSRKGRRGK